ncbi:MAG: hypothetical protein V1855_04515 [bacterium]
MIKKNNGFVVIVALMMVSLMILLTQQLLQNVTVSSVFIKTMVDRERAEMLALSGLEIAMFNLLGKQEGKKKKEGGAPVAPATPPAPAAGSAKGTEKKKLTEEQRFLQRILPFLNRWREYTLTEKLDGVDGQIKICISCEHGKININEIFDFKKQEFKKEYAALLQGLEIKGKFKAGEILKRLEEFLTKRRKKLDDVSELSSIKGLGHLDIFYKPPKAGRVISERKKEPSAPNTDLTLQDIFTIWTDKAELDPLFFSDSLCAIFTLRRPRADDAKIMKDKFKNFIENFKKEWAGDWVANWKNLELFYEQTPKFLQNIKDVFSKQFEPTVYSVLSCGKVGQVEQYLLAIIKKVDKKQDEEKAQGKDEKASKGQAKPQGEESSKPEKTFKIIRTYWL